MKHTPAPWTIEVIHYNGFRIKEWNGDAKEDVANNLLISAAPELLEALEEAKIQIEYLHEKFTETGSGNSTLSKIKSAIAKAKGL